MTAPIRGLVAGEIALLKTVFADTLPYATQQITTNDSNIGGPNNSITADGTPHFATNLWCYDFSIDGEPHWVFVHEFGHVWQKLYGTPPILGALAAWLENPGSYGDAYFYDLTTSTDFMDYNIEQQASICADYWAVLNGIDANKCQNPSKPQVADYAKLIAQVQNPNGAAGATASNDQPAGAAPATDPAPADPAPADPQPAATATAAADQQAAS